MASESNPAPAAAARHRPRTTTVFVAAFVAGAVAAVGVNRFLDIRVAQARPQVECEPIFVALRSLPQGAPVTVWDVALRDWPKAMMPATALRAADSFTGCVLKHPVQEGKPLLAAQLVRGGENPPQQAVVEEPFVSPPPAQTAAGGDDLWTPAGTTAGGPARPAPSLVATVAPPPDASATEVPLPQDPAVPMTTETAEPPVASAEPNAVAVTEPSTVAPAEPITVAVTEPSTVAPVEPAHVVPPEPNTVSAPPATDEPAGEPAAESIAPMPTEPSQPAATAATTSQPPRPATAPDVPTDPLPLPVDIDSLPSVMAGSAETATEEAVQPGDRLRYLVVPERIARQADTSFTTPTAQPPRSESTAAAAVDQPADVPTKAAEAPVRRPPGPSAARPRPATERPAQPPAARTPPDRAFPGPRAWGGVFPNVSAGLESLGGWRTRARENVAEERPTAVRPAR